MDLVKKSWENSNLTHAVLKIIDIDREKEGLGKTCDEALHIYPHLIRN